jgi:hypothetical protein
MEIRNIGTTGQGDYKPQGPPPQEEKGSAEPVDSAEIAFRRGPTCYMYAKAPKPEGASSEEVGKKRKEALEKATDEGLVQPETAKKVADSIEGFNVSQ